MNKLSAGLCDNCKLLKMHHEGNGYNEATLTLCYCSVDNIEIVPYPESHKKDRVLKCIFFEPIKENK